MRQREKEPRHQRRRRLRSDPFVVFFLLLMTAVSWRLTTILQHLVDSYDNDNDIDSQESTENALLLSFSGKQVSSLAFSASSVKPPQQFTLSDGTVVSVGEIGPNVTYAVEHAFVHRNQGLHWDQWDIVENPNCANDYSTTNDNIPTSSSSFATLSRNTPTHVIRKHWLPEAILIGVQKGGTTALHEYIDRHPDVAKSQKELYFLDELVDQLMLQHQQRNTTTGIPQVTIRQEYAHRMKLAIKKPQRDAGKMILDFTPNYMYQSDRLPARIACNLPWAKIVALLRNPVHRARSQYDMKLRLQPKQQGRRHRGLTGRSGKRSHHNLSFQQYILNDLAALQETGVIQNWDTVDFDTFFDSPAMDEAWRTYLNNGLNAPIDMGLYAIQLKPFLRLDNDFLAIQSEKLRQKTDETYGQVLEFLGLPRIRLDWYHKANNAGKRDKTRIDQQTEHLLYQVFAPFNRKLGELLGNEWRVFGTKIENAIQAIKHPS
jgi:hypothetical protein